MSCALCGIDCECVDYVLCVCVAAGLMYGVVI